MTYWFEKQAQQNEPMPDGVTAEEAQMYSFLRNLYWSLDHKIISTEQAQREKNIMEKLIDKGKKEREFENYEDYEDHLTELKIKEEQKKKEESKKEIKLKHIDEIVIHDEE